ncbi:hypothetical protein [Algicola sagamiensis]|uniref:hypothetical protein n=1 Tax=Algicola sagamiensis TaxID=163869 RepID=UPI0003614C4A|nr:hypothetical protein [Algicola sagamiensis]
MKYYKSYSESHNGDEGIFFCEVEDGVITRHISVYGEIMYWATPSDEFDEEYFFTDQPEFEMTEEEEEISQEEFSLLWEKAVAQ